MKVHGKMKTTKNHRYTLLSERSQQLESGITQNITLLKQKIAALKASTKFYESIIREVKATKKCALEKSKVLRKAFHKDINKCFDTIDERIENACSTNLTTFNDENQAMIVNMEAYVDLTTQMDSLMAKTGSELLAKGEQLLNKAKELSQSLAALSTDVHVVEIPQVRLERGHAWSLEGAVHLQLVPVQRRHRVSIKVIGRYWVDTYLYVMKIITFLHSMLFYHIIFYQCDKMKILTLLSTSENFAHFFWRLF